MTGRRPQLVAGPQLAHAHAEIAAIAGAYRVTTVLTSEEATVQATLEAMNGCGIVHICAHGHHERETCCSPGSTWQTAR